MILFVILQTMGFSIAYLIALKADAFLSQNK